MKRLALIAALLGALIALPAAADAYTQQASLAAADVAAHDMLGSIVAMSGNTLVVVAPSRVHPNDSNSAGAAYVFERPASGWSHATQTAQLALPAGAASVGYTSISGDTIALSSSDAKVGPNDAQGAIFIFEKPASGWQDSRSTAELTASDGKQNSELGNSGATISGDTVVATDGRTAYVFTKPTSGWKDAHETAKLTSSDSAQLGSDLRGVATTGDTVAVGAPGAAVGGHPSQGAVYVFSKPASGWVTSKRETAKLTAVDGAAGDGLGAAVAASGDVVVAGAPGRTIGSHGHQGAIYVYVKPILGWLSATQTAELTASDGGTSDVLGRTVAMSGDTVVAGALLHAVGDHSGQGAAYVFARPSGSIWKDATQTQELTATDGAAGDAFGSGVTLDGHVAAVGAPFRQVGDNKMAGAAYVFGEPPSIAVDAPADGATLMRAQAVAASYSCASPTGAAIASCAGPVASGAAIDTSTLGPHAFMVEALDSEGVSNAKSVSYTVVATPPPKAPSITALKQSVARWREAGKRPLGTTFSFRLDQPARVTLHFTRRGKPVGSLGASGHAGVNRLPFRGRLSRKKSLRPGRYAVRLTATNATGQRGRSRRLAFSIVR